MPDPGVLYEDRKADPRGVGPFSFQNPELQPGDVWVIDTRERDGGRLLIDAQDGFDNSELVNEDTQATVEITRNESRTKRVPANTIRGFTMPGQYRFDIENTSANVIDPGNLELSISRSAFGADERARERSGRNPLEKIVGNFTGL